MMAHLLTQNNDLAGALEELNKFIAGYPEHPLLDQAHFRAAVLTIEKGELKVGADQLEAFVNKFPQSSWRPMARLRQGDALVALGEKAKAVEVYEGLTKDTTLAGNPVVKEALNRVTLARLKPPTEVEFVPEPAADPPQGAVLPTPSPGAPPTLTPGAPPTLTPEVKAPSLDLNAPAQPTPAELTIPPPATGETPAPAASPTTPTEPPAAPAPVTPPAAPPAGR